MQPNIQLTFSQHADMWPNSEIKVNSGHVAEGFGRFYVPFTIIGSECAFEEFRVGQFASLSCTALGVLNYSFISDLLFTGAIQFVQNQSNADWHPISETICEKISAKISEMISKESLGNH